MAKTRYRWVKPKPMRCWRCGKPFEAIRCTAFLCSAACRQAWSRAKRKGQPLKRHSDALGWW